MSDRPLGTCRLLSRDGQHLVRDFPSMPWKVPPDVLVWGARHFAYGRRITRPSGLGDHFEYREVFAACAMDPDQMGVTLSEDAVEPFPEPPPDGAKE